MVGLSSVLNKKNLSLQPNRPFVSWIDVDKDMYINMLVLLHRALLKLSKWFGGLWLTRIVNRASEFLTGLWQDSVVHYSRGICQKLYGLITAVREWERFGTVWGLRLCPCLSSDDNIKWSSSGQLHIYANFMDTRGSLDGHCSSK